jgi:hypothetical protein
MTEAEYLAEVYQLCHTHGVYVHHCRHAYSCEGAGFPDLVLIGVHGVLWREVKASHNDRMKPEQTGLIWLLRSAGQDAAVWTAADLQSGKVAKELASIA